MPTNVAVFGYLLAFGAGVSFTFQQAVNANLRVEIASAWWAGFVSYVGGTIVMLLLAAAMRQPWPSMEMIYRSHWLSWTGGAFGAIYIAISILLLPRLGAATVIALIVAGQMIGSIFLSYELRHYQGPPPNRFAPSSCRCRNITLLHTGSHDTQ